MAFAACPTGTSFKVATGGGMGGVGFPNWINRFWRSQICNSESQSCVKLQPGQGKWEESSLSHTFSQHHSMPGGGMRPARVNAALASPGGSSAPTRMTLSVTHTAVLEQPGCCHLLAHPQIYNSCLTTTFAAHYCFKPGIQRRRTDWITTSLN